MLSSDLLRLPPTWDLILGLDTGTYMGAVFCGITPAKEAYVLAEVPNYTYIAGEYELLGYTISEWAARVKAIYHQLQPGRTPTGWLDPNSQFKTELRLQGIACRSNKRGEVLRTEIAREYMQADMVRFAPWLEILPYEIENAQWPPEESSTGLYRRLKEKDHILDGFEHALSRRPRAKRHETSDTHSSFVQRYLAQHAQHKGRRVDPHLGAL